MNEQFVVRFVSPDERVREFECRDGRIVTSRRERTSSSAPVLEFALPRLLDDDAWGRLPVLEDPSLHSDVLVVAGDALHRLFPLAITSRQEPKELLADLAMLWVLRDGPFGVFAWRNAFLDGRCVVNDTVPVEATENTPWDIVIEIDFADCVDYFLGHLEFRDLIAQGHVEGSVYAISAVTWFAERDEMLERAALYRLEAELLRDWVRIARSDAVLAGSSGAT